MFFHERVFNSCGHAFSRNIGSLVPHYKELCAFCLWSTKIEDLVFWTFESAAAAKAMIGWVNQRRVQQANQNEWPWPLHRGRMVMSTIASLCHWIYSRKRLKIEARFQKTINRNWPMWIEWSRDRWRHVALKGQVVSPISLWSAVIQWRSAILATAWLLVW